MLLKLPYKTVIMADEEFSSFGNVKIRAAAHVAVLQLQTQGTKRAAGKEQLLSSIKSDISDDHGSLTLTPMRLGPEKSRFHQRCVKYYSRQSRQTLGQTAVEVPVWISTVSEKTRVHHNWYPFLDSAIAEINQAAPGLHLHKVADKADSKVRIYRASTCEAYAKSDIRRSSTAEIYLGDDFEDKQQTSLHEIYHALGVDHEHQRKDIKFSMKNTNPSSDHNRGVQKTVQPLTRFDPFSVMLYPEDEQLMLRRRTVIDRVWELKPSTTINRVLSELDKVGLNLLYPPCKRPHYNPKKSPLNGMWYCGRHVMASHNTPAESTTDGRCGPDNWANCPACRTLMNPKVDEFVAQVKWQGWSGLVYCGKLFGKQSPGHDGYCGPDNGDPCVECGRILFPGYQGIVHSTTSANEDCVLL